MENNLLITIVQPDISWEDPLSNQKKYLQWLEQVASVKTDVIIFPETFLTGFSMNTAKLAETVDGKNVSWMLHLAKKHAAIVAGSLIVRGNDKPYNRLVFASHDGSLEHYDKRHLFRMGEEHKHYSRGNHRTIVNIGPFRILPAICYDLRFPVWLRNKNDYDVMVCVANWPAVRQHVWETLLIARAIENQCYTIGVNRTGRDGRNIEYVGGSVVVDPKGHILTKLNHHEGIGHVCLDIETLHESRKKFPVHLDADDFEIKNLPG